MKKQQKKSKHIYIIYKWTSYIRSGKTDQITNKGATDIPPKIFILFLVTSFRKGFTKEYAMGNSLGAVKKKIKVKTKNKVGTTSRRNILYEKVSGAKGTGFFCGTRLMVSVSLLHFIYC